jgi:hypothetical protein
MKQRMAILRDFTAFWMIVILAYGVVGFLRGRQTVRSWLDRLTPGRPEDL